MEHQNCAQLARWTVARGLCFSGALGCCARSGPPKSPAVQVVPVTEPSNHPTLIPLPEGSTAPCPDKPRNALAPLDLEYMARHMDAVWVEVSSERYAAAYFVPGGRVFYIFPEVAAPVDRFPLHGTFSGEAFMSVAQLGGARLICMKARVRYLRTDDGKMMMIGFYDPGHHAFFRWRGELREPEDMNFHAADDAMSPEVNPGRVQYIIDIDEPPGGRELEPS
jgi:hypothetical protein